MTAPPSSPRQRWLVPVVVVVLSVTVGAGLLARELYRSPDQQPADDSSSVALVPAPASLAPGAEPGPETVTVSPDVERHPQNEAVRSVVQTYFSSINARDYQRWQSVVSAERRRGKTLTQWRDDFRSTKDGSIHIYRIERGAGTSLRVLVGFTSTQDPRDGPFDMQEKCVRWRLVLPLVVEGNALKIDTVENGQPPYHEKC